MKYNSHRLSQIICHVIRLNRNIYFSMAEPDRNCLYCIFCSIFNQKKQQQQQKEYVCELYSHLKLSSVDCRNGRFFHLCLLVFPLRCKLLLFFLRNDVVAFYLSTFYFFLFSDVYKLLATSEVAYRCM